MMLTLALMATTKAGPPIESALTIYNDGFSQVREQRELDLTDGPQSVLVEDVAQMIEANSVSVRSLSHPGSIRVLEQNYQYDLVSPMAILNKSVGQRIRFHRALANGNKEVISGTLISAPYATVADANGGTGQTYNGMVIRTDNGGILLNPTGEIEVTELPAGLISRPSLQWVLDAKAGRNRIEFGYLTKGFSWKCDYVLSLDKEGKTGSLKAWVTLTNNSGTRYENAKLSFLAGEVNRVSEVRPAPSVPGGRGRAVTASEDSIQTQEIGEYYLYKLKGAVSVPDKSIKQVSLMEKPDIQVGQLLTILRPPNLFEPRLSGEVSTGPLNPEVYTTIKNDEINNLGIALPKGTFKVFQADQNGETQFMGEDYIRHTPRNELLKILTGKAFDVVVEFKQISVEYINGDRNEGPIITYEAEIRNRKRTPVTVQVLDSAGPRSTIDSQLNFNRVSTYRISWELSLQPNETKSFRYTITTPINSG